ncbi:glutamate mutase L [Irregularibacter muris]|uniref:Glutamate mutase L n=1 Tax=Irregularibacter muris TaxID=1796619 RepID=A0AAE3HHB8_9FIRM|nr:glutamate mutase L [Irregularibacter muris]MCR1899435.1 glutamate mutase L [Irregularibacter muris]
MEKYDYLIIDIGSTYTKQRLFKDAELIATVQSPTTIENIYQGIQAGRREMEDILGEEKIEARHVLSSSSAAGGLRMVAMGYMTRVTAKAAKEVAMNSGAKILEIVSNENPPEYRIEILREIDPDIILLAGGTDFGDESSLIENAALIVESKVKGVVVIAGNINAQDKVAEILGKGQVAHIKVPNIMPTIHKLRVKEAREAIHREFIKQITKAQGLSILQQEITNDLVVPTPGAVLMASELLAKGTYLEKGLGEVIVVDLGGATTDIHSVIPSLEDLDDEERGLIVSNEKQVSYRTVEGNLGMRISAMGVLDVISPKGIFHKKGLDDSELLEEFLQYCKNMEKTPRHIASNQKEYLFDTLLAETAVEIALKRHAGYISTVADPVTGIMPGMPIGRDLRNVQTIIGVGGIFSHREPEESKSILKNALKDKGISLLPNKPEILIDENYLLYTGGIISQIDEDYAMQVLKNQFK